MPSVRQRLHRLETLANALGAGVCGLCHAGAYPFAIHRWFRADCSHFDEPESSNVYDGHGTCRRCGCSCANPVYLVLPDCVRDRVMARLK